MKKPYSISFTFLAFILIASDVNAFGDISIIGHPSNTIELTQDDISKIFLGKLRKFPNNTPAKPVDQQEGRKIREEFYVKTCMKDPTELKVYWSNLIFTGNGFPPSSLVDDIAVKTFVAQTPNAIGYIDSSVVDKSVHVYLEIK